MKFDRLIVALLMLLVALCAAFPVLAQTTPAPAQIPAFSAQRLSIAAGANYNWWGEDNVPPKSEEFGVGIYGAYALTAPLSGAQAPAVSLIASVERGFDNRTVLTRVGLRVTLFNGGR
jgi:hypothetical protein